MSSQCSPIMSSQCSYNVIPVRNTGISFHSIIAVLLSCHPSTD
ncbi:hypothetical protein [Wolbachia endosymbiont (group A) of Portevinia maculata]